MCECIYIFTHDTYNRVYRYDYVSHPHPWFAFNPRFDAALIRLTADVPDASPVPPNYVYVFQTYIYIHICICICTYMYTYIYMLILLHDCIIIIFICICMYI